MWNQEGKKDFQDISVAVFRDPRSLSKQTFLGSKQNPWEITAN